MACSGCRALSVLACLLAEGAALRLSRQEDNFGSRTELERAFGAEDDSMSASITEEYRLVPTSELVSLSELVSQSMPVKDVPELLSFSPHVGDLTEFRERQRKFEQTRTELGKGEAFRANLVGGSCNDYIRPFSDFDTRQGHAHPRCRYEPGQDELREYQANPIDLAILLPYDESMQELPSDASKLVRWQQHGAAAWRAYAEHHGYKFYLGPLRGENRTRCFGQLRRLRDITWVKVCAALEMIRSHEYFMMVDADSFVTKPLLRLEPLFAKAGLLEASSGKVVALAEEWGSCRNGFHSRKSGERNTGIMLLKNTAEELLHTWFFNPGCKGRGCELHDKSLKAWSFDQLGFEAVIAGQYRDSITTWPSGCPVNGPWGDFISHLVGGSFDSKYYDKHMRGELIKSAHTCVTGMLKKPPRGDIYKRCSLCGLLPSNATGFEISCAPSLAALPI